ncbi:hypothetical protein MCHIJ_32790 [Mycolicibacterium chitae]|uniref:Uncharacterized protein n=1 Tax=Mycolicibacterium chitae TaxID=1792 RepID=A0A448I571_MYCCI|nr:hypothetical protein [Mycolicibacterium chitae]MCV7105305.1 hypothetical protein [Mycolicibacterium chitae]BBZ03842.1 hypothetical protein MCHIJ_32790 [Mycolicibacterium chitae]VEG47493.1 Uncharacterised protein [Mycolicibacterium chitae]
MTVTWRWEEQSRNYANYGNANQWTVNAGLSSLARESAQNSNDARLPGPADLVYSFIVLSGDDRQRFEDAVAWHDQLEPHLAAMADAATGAVTAGQLQSGLAALKSAESLTLLRIADYGAKGLTGPEFAEGDADAYGNFVKLCRLDLYSGKDKTSGGSFGLGKAVYWRFSRLQTVLFNSTLQPSDAVNGRRHNRIIGVNQGVVHQLSSTNFQGRGFFGVQEANDDVASVWEDADLAHRLWLRREDDRPGTSALLLGFYDPDEPEKGLGDIAQVHEFAKSLEAAIEEEFWPLLTRDRLRVRVEVLDGDRTVYQHTVDPEEQYTELVRALRKVDAGQIDDELNELGDVVVRDVPISISARTDAEERHIAFEHTAKLVVTLSDDQKDSLENKVCLFRRPEMVVQTVDKEFEGRTYHAFLMAGAAVNPDSPSLEEERADDFLRFAEPPAHDQWIPGSGRTKTSQANLTAHYKAPWVPNLRNIRQAILDQLSDIFGAPAPSGDTPPKSIFKNLAFLQGESGGSGARGTASVRKPEIRIHNATVVDGAWHLDFEIRARNRPEGWSVEPRLALVGLDGGYQDIPWDQLDADPPAEQSGNTVVLLHKPRGRLLTTTVRGVSTTTLPIPAMESAVDIRIGRADVAPTSAQPEAQDIP